MAFASATVDPTKVTADLIEARNGVREAREKAKNEPDPLHHARTTRAGLIERALIAPYYVNYHLEHHLLAYVPCYNLPRVHEILMRGPLAAHMEIQPGYSAIMRMATSKPANEDRPGDLASNVRRARAGVAVDENQAASGF